MEIAKGFYQVLHFYHFIVLYFRALPVLDARWIKDTGKLCEDIIWSANATHFSLVKKSHALATAHLVEIRC